MARIAPGLGNASSYLALGDSYTIGEGVHEQGRWPMQLVAMLRARGQEISDPRIIATSGWTTDELATAMDEAEQDGLPRTGFGLVTLQIGVNDQYRGRNTEQFGAAFIALLDRAIAFADGDASRVLVVSIPDWGVTPFARANGRDRGHVAGEIDLYNALAQTAVGARGATWVDVTGISRDDAFADNLVDDGLHPSTRMYEAWTLRIAEAIAS